MKGSAAMHTHLVMTVIGPDKPGLVGSVSQAVARHGGNWLESRMAHLAGQFAGILRVAVKPESSEALIAELRGLERVGLRVVIETSAEAEAPAPHRRVHLELIGQDRPGIVRQITELIAARGVNIDELTTKLISAPMTGEPMFFASAMLQIPGEVDPEDLRRDLEDIATDLMVDLTLTDAAEDAGSES